MKFSKITKLSYRFLFVLCLSLLTACGSKQIHGPDLAMDFDDSAMLESYRVALKDGGLPLTDVEMRALLSVGELDRNLSAEELREVKIFFRHLVHNARPTVERLLQRSQPYIDFTRSVFRERGMPEELAYLAFVESGYNPIAVSRSNAVGMWQFMAPTGRQYGLVQTGHAVWHMVSLVKYLIPPMRLPLKAQI